jgi:hypothetical protein
MSLISGQQPRSYKSNFSSKYGAPPAGKTYQEKKQEALAAKNTVVVGYDDLERIKAMCKQTNDT